MQNIDNFQDACKIQPLKALKIAYFRYKITMIQCKIKKAISKLEKSLKMKYYFNTNHKNVPVKINSWKEGL